MVMPIAATEGGDGSWRNNSPWERRAWRVWRQGTCPKGIGIGAAQPERFENDGPACLTGRSRGSQSIWSQSRIPMGGCFGITPASDKVECTYSG